MNTISFPFSLNRNQLKIIAIITMTIDHIAFAFSAFLQQGSLYHIMKVIGRIAFPIFCFLLVEGFFYTSNRRKYIKRLLIFALIAEIPFDFAIAVSDPFFEQPLYFFQNGNFFPFLKLLFSRQNTLFTLSISMLAMTMLEKGKHAFSSNPLLQFFICAFSMGLAQLCGFDYGMFGVFFILCLYYRKTEFAFVNPYLSLLVCFVPLMTTGGHEPFCILAFPLLALYNPIYCKGSKYFFYIYYPLHLAVLSLLRFL